METKLTLTIIFNILVAQMLFSQRLLVQNVEMIDDSTKKAKILILDNANNTIEIDTNFIKIFENNSPVEIIKIECPEEETTIPVSSVLTIDESGSMLGNGINIAKSAARAWVEKLFDYNQQSECAINAFSHYNRLLTDFTDSPYYLEYAINSLYPNGGTDYEQALISTPQSGINIASRGRHKKIVVFLTDGMPNQMPNIKNMINLANLNQISIYPVVIGFQVPSFLEELAAKTNGLAYGNVNNVQQAEEIYSQILKIVVTQKFCEIIWKSNLECGQIEFVEQSLKLSRVVNFYAPDNMIAKLNFASKYISLGVAKKGYKYFFEIPISAINDTVLINDLSFRNSLYRVKNENLQYPIKLAPMDSLVLKVEFKADNLDSLNDFLDIFSNTCENYFIEFFGIKNIESSTPPQARKGFGVSSLLFELNNINNSNYSGYNFGLGLQLYFSDRFSIRLSYGFIKDDTYSLLTDRTNIDHNSNYLSSSLRYNMLEYKYLVAYIMPFYMYSFGSNSQGYFDSFTNSIINYAHSFGLGLGTEIFTFHNVSLSAEYVIRYQFLKVEREIGFTKKITFPIYEKQSINFNPKLRLILSYFIN